jgi:signal transduction histidine kinase/ActR/RegA family two-component response regulator
MQNMKFEYRFIAGYIILGGLWILFSDKLLNYFIHDPDLLTEIQTFKGSFYVIVTAIIFYIILKTHLIKIRDAEQKAIDSDKLKTAFLQNISHEIRTPMNSIIGFSGLLKDKNSTELEKVQYLDMIAKGSDQLLNIVNEVLDISLIETGNLRVNKQRLHLNNLMDDSYNLFKPIVKKDIAFTAEKGLPDPLSIILTDTTKVRQVINNLLNNAIKFTDKGFIHFGYFLKNNELEFYVEDSGIGIDQAYHNKIFERFLKVGLENKRLYDGVGLGLAICKGNIDLLKGRIWLESKPDEGSRFYFTIPYERFKEEEGEKMILKKAESIKDLSDLTVLVAEDDQINYIYISEIFRGTGAKILHATDGQSAVNMVKENIQIGLVLIDIKMPVMNGYEAIKKIREFRPDLPIIAQTAFALSDEMLKAFNAGSNDYISKPFKKDQLLALVMKHLSADEQ